jgi:hypothetical protein
MVEWLRSGHVIRETFAVIFVAISSIILCSIVKEAIIFISLPLLGVIRLFWCLG